MLTYLFTSRYQLNKPYRVNSLVFIDHRDSRPLILYETKIYIVFIEKKMKIDMHDTLTSTDSTMALCGLV